MDIKLHALSQTFHQGSVKTVILDQLETVFHSGQSHAILGSSGSGKSTLLHILAGLAPSSSGHVTYDGGRFSWLNPQFKRQFFRSELGMIYQHHHLVMELSALQNVMLSLKLARIKKPKAVAMAMLTQVGMASYANHMPHMLSGGQKQRVAIARALAKKPRLVIADEPTGSLDNQTASEVANVLFDVVKASGATLIIATHDLGLADCCETTFMLKDAKLIDHQHA